MIPATQDQKLIAKRTVNALERLDQVEKTIANLTSAINNSLMTLNNQTNAQGEVLEAVVAVLGNESIDEKIKELRVQKATEAMEAEKSALEALKASGEIVATQKVTDKSVIVGKEFNQDGSVRVPGRVQVAFQRIDAKFQPDLLGKEVGNTIDLPEGRKFEIVEIYEVAPKKEEPVAEAAPAEPSKTEG